MSAPLSAEQYELVSPEDLLTYQPQISSIHSFNATQKVDLIVLSKKKGSAEKIVQTLAKKPADGKRILWYNGSTYYELKEDKLIVQGNKFKSEKVVYIHDLLHDEGNELHDQFSKAPIVPVAAYYLDAKSSESVRISRAAPYVLLKLRDGSEHHAPMLYLDFENFELDWTKVDAESTNLGDFGNLAQSKRPSFDIPAAPRSSEGEPSKSASSSAPSSSSKSPATVPSKELSLEATNELYNLANAHHPSKGLILFGLFIALAFISGATYRSSLFTGEPLLFLVANNRVKVNAHELPTTNEVLAIIEEKGASVYQDTKIMMKQFFDLLQGFASFIFKDGPVQLYQYLKKSIEPKPHNAIIPSGSSRSLRQKIAETYIQGAVEIL